MLEIVKRPDGAEGFEILPRRWVVEGTFAWLGRCRRLVRNFERDRLRRSLDPRRPRPPAHEAHRKIMKSMRSF